jgi:transposase
MIPRQESAMRAFQFTDRDLAGIRHDRFYHPHPRVQLKAEVLWLKAHGLPHTEVARLAGVSRRTAQRYLDEFLHGGLAAVRRVRFRQPVSELSQHQATLEDYFLGNPPHSAAEAQAAIERLTGVRRGLTQVRQFLKKVSAWPTARSA